MRRIAAGDSPASHSRAAAFGGATHCWPARSASGFGWHPNSVPYRNPYADAIRSTTHRNLVVSAAYTLDKCWTDRACVAASVSLILVQHRERGAAVANSPSFFNLGMDSRNSSSSHVCAAGNASATDTHGDALPPNAATTCSATTSWSVATDQSELIKTACRPRGPAWHGT